MTRSREMYREMNAAADEAAIRRENAENGVAESRACEDDSEFFARVQKKIEARERKAGPAVVAIVAQLAAEGVQVRIDESRKHGVHIVAGPLSRQRFYIDGTYDSNYTKLPWTVELLRSAIAEGKGF